MTAAETRVAVLLALMRQLQEVMRAENGLLRDLKLARLRELQTEKAALAGHYELELRRLRQAPEPSRASARSARTPAREQHARVPGDGAVECRPAAAGALGRGGRGADHRPQPRRRPAGRAPRYAGGPQAAADDAGAGDPRGLRPPLLGARPCPLNAVLSNALSGLAVAQNALTVTSNNVANVNTEGYSRQVAQQEALVIDGRGAGAQALATTRMVDELLSARLREQQARAGPQRGPRCACTTRSRIGCSERRATPTVGWAT